MKKPQIKIKIKNPSRVFNKHIYDKLTDYSTFTEIHYGGASSGKSHGVIQKVVFKSLQAWKYPRKVLFCGKLDQVFMILSLKMLSNAWKLGAYLVLVRLIIPLIGSNYQTAPNLFSRGGNPEKISLLKVFPT